MKCLKFAFLAIFIFCLNSCHKDDESLLRSETAERATLSDERGFFRTAHNFENCTDDISQEEVNLAMRSYIKKVVDLEISAPQFEILGKPFYASIITDTFEDDKFGPYAVSYVPFTDENNSQVKSLMIFYTNDMGSEYVLLDRNDIQNSDEFSIKFELDDESIKKGKRDFLEIFSVFDYYTNCENQVAVSELRGGGIGSWWRKIFKLGPPCPSPAGGVSKPCRKSLLDWLNGVFGSGDFIGTNFIFISGFDVGFPWGQGQGGMSNFPPNIIGGGNGPLNQSFLDAILFLQMDCSEEVDPDGAGIDTGVIEEETLNPTALLQLEQWCYFKDKCLSDEFSGYQPLAVPINGNTDYALNPYYDWGEYYSNNAALFMEIINVDYGCVDLDDLGTIECISDNYDDFVTTYNLDFTESEEREFKKALVEAGCNDSSSFEEIASGVLFDKLNETLDLDDNKDCIGSNPEQLAKLENLLASSSSNSSIAGYENEYINAFADVLCENPDFDIELPGLTECENELIQSNPVCAALIAKNTVEALLMTKILFGTIWGSNGCPDAFRHTFYSALNTSSCGVELAEQFGDAHECGNGPELATATEMDLHNNSIGRNIYTSRQPPPDFTEMVKEACFALSHGELEILTDVNDTTSPTIPSTGCSCEN